MIAVVLYLIVIWGCMSLVGRRGNPSYDPYRIRKEWEARFSDMCWQERCKQIDLEQGNPWRGGWD